MSRKPEHQAWWDLFDTMTDEQKHDRRVATSAAIRDDADPTRLARAVTILDDVIAGRDSDFPVRRTDDEIRRAIAAIEKAQTDTRATKSFKVYSYIAIEAMRWTLGEAEHPMQSHIDHEAGR